MVKKVVDSPTSSPVTITVTSSGGSRSIRPTSPMPRRQSISNNPNSPLESRRRRRCLAFSKESTDEFVAYTVQIPSTPDNQILSDSQSNPPLGSSKSRGKIPNEGFIKDTIFTGGFSSVTKAHMRKSSDNVPSVVKLNMMCEMDGCDEKAIGGNFKSYCECGFGICRDCYLDCLENGGGNCLGCKEPYKDDGGDEEEEEEEPPTEEDQAREWCERGEREK